MKRVISILMLLALCLSLAACKRDKDETEGTEAVEEGYTAYVSTSASLGGSEVDFSEKEMTMLLALFDDGIFQMTVEVAGEALENFPQEGNYTIADGILTLESGWSGEISDTSLELSYGEGAESITFHCTKSE